MQSSTREEILEKLLKSYKTYYDITMFGEEDKPLRARCDFHEHSQRYMLSRKIEIWSANSHEFLYLFEMPQLTLEEYERCRDFVYEDGMSRMEVGPGHMYSYLTPIFICNSCEAEARKAIKKCRIYKSFHFSLHGWMDFHTAVVSLEEGRIDSNRSGRYVAKILKKIVSKK